MKDSFTIILMKNQLEYIEKFGVDLSELVFVCDDVNLTKI